MLAYQHLYHAGNLADVQKHAALAWMLDYLTQKPKPISYLETHAGRGLYDLAAPESVKTGEAAAGIAKVEDWFEPDHPYARALADVRAQHGETAYPGSPAIAMSLLRPEDRVTLAELHPAEHDALRKALPGARIKRQDGAEMALSLCPPEPRRGMLLIDPSYEGKADYLAMPDLMAKVHRKWNVGIIMLWYPILSSHQQVPMVRALRDRFPDGFSHEVHFPPAREGHRMVGSGLFVVNPPWGLAEELDRLAPRFAALK